jgi:hypothetical protein
MFTGFASENTPAIQVWDFFRTFASTNSPRLVTLADDCAPIQVFRTGATANSNINVYLPTSPIEGKQITIVNQRYGISAQRIEIYSSDTSGNGSAVSLFLIGASDSITLVYSKQNITYGTTPGVFQTGWISLNKGSPTAVNSYAAISGGEFNTASASHSFIGGGLGNIASGIYASVVGGANNTASSSSSVVVGGAANTANSSSAAVVGGSSNTASNTGAAVIGGTGNTASGSYAVVLGSDSSQANAQGAIILGGYVGTTRSIINNAVFPSGTITPLAGRSQTGVLVLGRQTTDATVTTLASTGGVASTTNQVILPNNSAYTFQGTCVANVTGGGTTSGWKFEGVIKRGANAASTVLVAAVTPLVIAQDAGAVTWVLAITADTTNGGIAVTVTGAAATTIRWVAKIETTEVTF